MGRKEWNFLHWVLFIVVILSAISRSNGSASQFLTVLPPDYDGVPLSTMLDVIKKHKWPIITKRLHIGDLRKEKLDSNSPLPHAPVSPPPKIFPLNPSFVQLNIISVAPSATDSSQDVCLHSPEISPALIITPVNHEQSYGIPVAAPSKELSGPMYPASHSSKKKGSSPMMSPISHEGKHIDSPLPSHPNFFGSSLVMSSVSHEIKPPPNAHAPLASHFQRSGPSYPMRSPMPHEDSTPSNVALPPLPSPYEVKNSSNSTHAPFSSYSLPTGSSSLTSPSPHEVKEPSAATHSPLPLESSPSISPSSHEMKEPSNNTHSPLPSHSLPLKYSPENSPAPHYAAGPSIISHPPLTSHPNSSGLYPTISHVNSSFPPHPLPLEFSPAISQTPHEVKDPSNIMHAPLASDPEPLRISPMISPTPHEVMDPSNITHSHLPLHPSPESSPLPTPHFSTKDPSNILHVPLPSHSEPSRISPMISPTPHDVKEPSNITLPPLPSHALPSLSSPVKSPMPHEVKSPSNITPPPLSSHPIPSLSSPIISPAPHEVKEPSNITHSPLPSHPNPLENCPAVSPLPHGVKDISNAMQAPLSSHSHLTGCSPLLSPMPHEVKNATNIIHAPFSSHLHPPSERMIQTPALAPTISRSQHAAPLFSSPPTAHYPGPIISPVPSHIPEVPPKNKQRKYAPSPYIRGPSISPIQFLPHPRGVVPKHSQRSQAPLLSPVQAPFPAKNREASHAPSPSSMIPSWHNKWPIQPPILPPVSSRKPRAPPPQLVWALPPPPPNLDCKSLSCQEPVTYPPPGSLCVCVLPIKVSLRLSIAPYTFFPLVTELAQEIASGIFVKQSQVRIMGANAASEDPEKTVVLIYLVPLGRSFDINTALLIYERFWHKQVLIKASYFGDYGVLYVVYPGLPPSPPMAPRDASVDGGTFTNGENARRIKPLGVDVRKRKEKVSGSLIVIIVLSSVIALVVSVGAAWILLIKCRSPSRPPSTSQLPLSPAVKPSGSGLSILGSGPSSTSASFTSSTAKTFSLAEIERATNRFNDSRILGEGGFGRVYQGTLEDGTMVAVKVLKRDDNQGGREFLAEVEMLSRLHHRNLVKLIGICTEENVRCLVYELIPNGSVESHLHGPDKETSPLDWNARMKIALGAARGLAYLHEDSSPRVIHRDFKSSNILLEHDFTPKVSDFGLAREALDEESDHISTRVMGTFGYVAPEYAMTGHLLVKSDVYSYGVVLLELLTGRKPVDMSQPPGQETLVNWARPLLTSTEGLEKMIDPALDTSISLDIVAKVAAIASMCVQPEVSHRPFMGEVVQALKLVCNESDELRRSYSQDELSTMDSDVRISSEERMLSGSDIFCTSATFDKDASGSFRRYSSSGPMKMGRSERIWEKVRKFSSGSMIENQVAHGLGSGMESQEQWP